MSRRLFLAGYGKGSEVAYDATTRAPFIASVKRPLKLHMPDRLYAVWREGRFKRLAAFTRCGKQLANVNPLDAAREELELCDWCALADVLQPTVYRLLSPTGLPLYIGCTTNLIVRLAGHFTAHYWPLVGSWTVEHFDSIEEAMRAERDAILAENPPFNVDMTPRAKNPGRRPEANPAPYRRPPTRSYAA